MISEGEIDPKFGNKSDQVAYADTLNQLPNPNGFTRIVAAGDIAGGRYVSNLTNIAVVAASPEPGTGGGVTTQFSVQGAVSTSLTMTLASLEALPAYTETVTYLAGSTSVTDTYTGALLWDVLGAAGVVTDSTIKNDILRKAVAITGSDGYEVAFSLGEIDPMFGDDPILVAYSDDLGQLGDGGADGFARIVAPGDVRWRSLRLQHRQPDSLRRNDSARAGRRRIVPGWSGRSARVSPAPGLISFTSANVAERVSDRNALSSRS